MNKKIKWSESGPYEEVTREELIERIIDDNVNTILSGDMNDWLDSILNNGFDGYKNYSNSNLIREYYDLIDPDLSKPNIKIVRKRKNKWRNNLW